MTWSLGAVEMNGRMVICITCNHCDDMACERCCRTALSSIIKVVKRQEAKTDVTRERAERRAQHYLQKLR